MSTHKSESRLVGV